MTKQQRDHALAVVKAGVSAVPVVGGPLASLIGDYVPESTHRAQQKVTDLLQARLSALEGRLDVEAVDKEEFAELFKSCYVIVVHTNRRAKLKGVANLLANLLLKEGDPEKMAFTELDPL